jgi:hypothetical protein
VVEVGAVDFWGFEAIEGVGGSDGCAGGEEGENEEVVGFHAEGGRAVRGRGWPKVFLPGVGGGIMGGGW